MSSYDFTAKALEDLNDIWYYTYDEWSERQADKYYLELIETCEESVQDPNLGKNYPEIEPNIYGYLVNKQIIFFQRIGKHKILVVRILHANMDLKRSINE